MGWALASGGRWDDTVPAFIDTQGTLTGGEFRRLVDDQALQFSALGYTDGVLAPIEMTLSRKAIISLFALWHAGATPCPLNPRWTDGQVEAALSAIGCASGHLIIPGISAHSVEAPPHPASDLAAVIFTSGSTGVPKAVGLRESALLASAAQVCRRVGFDDSSRWLLSLPAYHVGGLGVLVRSAMMGAPIVLPDPNASLASSLNGLEITHLSLVSTQLYRLLREEPGTDTLSRCRAVVLGGGPTPGALIDEALEADIPLYNSFGMTETASMVCCTEEGADAESLRSAGRPLEENTIRISDGDDILVQGPTLFAGYLQQDGSLDSPLDGDRFFRTGDLGYLDAEGRLHITGRSDNRFVCGGENIQPETIEAALLECTGVEMAVVLPVDDPEYGKIPVAILSIRDDSPVGDWGIVPELRARLSGIEMPRGYHLWPKYLQFSGPKPGRADLAAWLASQPGR